MFLNNRNLALGKDGQSNSAGDVIPNIGSPMQTACSGLPRADTDMLIKVCLLKLRNSNSFENAELWLPFFYCYHFFLLTPV